MVDVEPSIDFDALEAETTTVYYAQTEGSMRYHLRRSCWGLQRAQGDVYETEAEVVQSDGGIELVSHGRLLCRICAPTGNGNGDGGN